MSQTRFRRFKDRFAGLGMAIMAGFAAALVVLITAGLLLRAWPLLESHSLGELLTSSVWSPQRGAFGFLPFILGTLWVTALAMVLAVPPCLLSAIYLSEYAPQRFREGIKPLLDLLAGIPSVVYGLWGVKVCVPLIRSAIAPWVGRHLSFVSLLAVDNPTGYSALAGGVVLAVMVFPVIIAVTQEVIRAVPDGLREASLALGATRWQMVKGVVLRRSLPGVIAAIVLGFSRAFGETMAVMMVAGNVAQSPRSIFDATYTLPALIANNYGEMMSIPLYDSALMTAALLLLLIVMVFTFAARAALLRAVRRAS